MEFGKIPRFPILDREDRPGRISIIKYNKDRAPSSTPGTRSLSARSDHLLLYNFLVGIAAYSYYIKDPITIKSLLGWKRDFGFYGNCKLNNG